MQNAVQKQQQSLLMLAQVSNLLNDTALAVVRKIVNGGSESSDSNEISSEQPGETTKSVQDIKAAALVDAVLTGEASADINTALQDAMVAALAKSGQDIQDLAEKIANTNEIKKDNREEAKNLWDEIQDWPDGETREITISTWEEGADGTYVKVEKTVSLTKDEAESLLDKLEKSLDEADSRGSSEAADIPYQLVEGSLIVGEAEISELVPNANEILEGLEIIDGQDEEDDTGISQEELEELYIKVNNLLDTADAIVEQISILKDLQESMKGSQISIAPVLLYAEEQSDGTYNMVPEATLLSEETIPLVINAMEETLNMIIEEM